MSQDYLITILLENREPTQVCLERFDRAEVTFGRDDSNDIVIREPYISSFHGVFIKTADGWGIHDKRSTNGIKHNGLLFSSRTLSDGDTFSIGDTSTRMGCVLKCSVQDSSQSNNSLSLTGKDLFYIGRHESCDLVLNNTAVSRMHCMIKRKGNDYYVVDNNSTNGVSVNGKPLVGEKLLQQNDRIMIVDSVLIFRGNSLSFQSTVIGVSAVNMTKVVKSGGKKKIINDNINLSIGSGEFVAIVGGSGAGKTTLLNCLSGVTDFTSGNVFINGDDICENYRVLKSLIGYVPQQDIVYDNISLRHMLLYTAKMRMPADTSRSERESQIDRVLEMVELTEQKNMLIKRLSGGQKKRASIAVELLSSPKLFFLDEPSSGLDPGIEKNLMLMLRKMTGNYRTVILVTHTVQNIDLCDKVIFMGKGGKLCFAGSPEDALKFFGVSDFTDIYQFLNYHSDEYSQRFARINAVQPIPEKSTKTKRKKGFSLPTSLRQFRVLTMRYADIIMHDLKRVCILLLMAPLLAFLLTLAFSDTFAIESAKDTQTYMFTFACCAFWVGIFNSIQEICKEKVIFTRERMAGLRLIPYVMSKVTVLGIVCLIQAAGLVLIASTDIVIPSDTVGITLEGYPWIELFITTLLTAFCAMALGLTVSALAENPDRAIVIAPVCLIPQILFSGVIEQFEGTLNTISRFVTCRWSCIGYFTTARINNLPETIEEDSLGIRKNAEAVLFAEEYTADTWLLFDNIDPVLTSWIALLIYSAVCILLAIVFLRLRDRRFKINKKSNRSVRK